MNKLARMVLLLCLSGALLVPLQSSAVKKPAPLNPIVNATVTSKPPGARVTYTAFGKSRDIGTTPFSWSFPLSDITRSSMIPTLTFQLAGHQTQTMALNSDAKVHMTLRANKAPAKKVPGKKVPPRKTK